ncbi:hypothetical protein I4U23_000425 [Adineta vaga]|nr:hypothetical protein I4U23_000425 [Adineta vaga]
MFFARKAEICIQFRDAPGGMFDEEIRQNDKDGKLARDELVIRVQLNEAVYLKLNTKRSGEMGFSIEEAWRTVDPILAEIDKKKMPVIPYMHGKMNEIVSKKKKKEICEGFLFHIRDVQIFKTTSLIIASDSSRFFSRFMAKILSYIILLVIFLIEFNQSAPWFANDKQRLVRQANPLWNAMRYSSGQYHQRNNYPISPEQEEAEPETVYVKMSVDSDEEPQAQTDLETKIINVYIDTKRRLSR